MAKAGPAQRRMEGDLFDRIGTFLRDHRLSPDPANYSFAHAVLSQPDTVLAREVERLTYGGVRLTAAAIAELGGPGADGDAGGEHMPSRESAATDRAEQLVAETQAQVDGFADMMRTMQIETRGFGRDLAESAKAIRLAPPSPALAPAAHDVARIAGAMIERVRESEAKLARATEEADALRTKLAEARAAARRDPLSGLANRLAFAEAFANRDPACAPHCVALCDVDRFKRINDQHGHGVGDRVLKAIADTLADTCESHMVARHGGEEFAILIGGTDLAAATALLDEARMRIADRRFRDRETGAALGTITLSAGISAVRAGESVDAALERADRLLYTAKAQGRDRICAE